MYPTWVVLTLCVICAMLGFCGALLSFIIYLFIQDLKSNSDEHRNLFRLVSGISGGVRVLLERTEVSAPKGSGTAGGP